MKSDFAAGVIEGFYGQPWTPEQRTRLVSSLGAWGLNTYFYAPKDDLKHRAIWRESYDEAELTRLAQLIVACQKHQIRFIYGLSPGLDIRFSDPTEFEAIQRRLDQLRELGVQDFALLFDDLPGQIHPSDQQAFDSVASAQCDVTNRVFRWLRREIPSSKFLFCPTPYCDRMDRNSLGGEAYLDTIGRLLDSGIDVFWTGPEIVSREITVASIDALARRLRRKPLIWDNLHANDYDLRRLYCGPYAGRSIELKHHVQGILLNPNNEFEMNSIPLKTLGRFVACASDWNERGAFLAAVTEWHSDYETTGESIELDDLVLLADCYYLPYEEGLEAARMRAVIEQMVERPTAEWGSLHRQFVDYHGRVRRTFDCLTQLKNRELFYAWSRRVWELKEEMELLHEYFERRLEGMDPEIGIPIDTHLPGTYRGGLVANLQRLMFMDADGRFRPRRDPCSEM